MTPGSFRYQSKPEVSENSEDVEHIRRTVAGRFDEDNWGNDVVAEHSELRELTSSEMSKMATASII